MKKIILLLFTLYCSQAFSQSMPNLEDVKLDSESSYPAADSVALKLCSYLLTIPFDKTNEDVTKGMRFLIKWIDATPTYTFTFDENMLKITGQDQDVTGLYMICLTKYTIENNIKSPGEYVSRIGATLLLLDYCENPKNNFKITEHLQKLIDAKKNGTLAKEI